jgi:excinuclease UvrABC nuclease subunit
MIVNSKATTAKNDMIVIEGSSGTVGAGVRFLEELGVTFGVFVGVVVGSAVGFV